MTRDPGGLPEREVRDVYEIVRFCSPDGPLARYHLSYAGGAAAVGQEARRIGADVVDVHHRCWAR